MKFLGKIVLFSVFLFCLAKGENKSQSVAITATQEESNLQQHLSNASFFIQPTTVDFTVVSQRIYTPSFALYSVVYFTLSLATTEAVAAKAFSFKSINRVPSVSFLLFPVHYFW
ncbi:MAG: hypothetical protein ACOVKP_00455 [Flavobacterium sp.]